MNFWTLVGLGCLGALFPDLIRIAKSHHDPALPAFLKSSHFFISLGAMIVLGVAAALLLKPDDPVEALAYAYGAPELLSRAFAAAQPPSNGAPPRPPLAPPKGGGSLMQMRDWWSR